MEPRNAIRIARNQFPAPRGWMWLAAAGVILTSITVTVALVRGPHHGSREDLANTEGVPNQSEPDSGTESIPTRGGSRSPVVFRGDIELTGYTADALEEEESEGRPAPPDGAANQQPDRDEPSAPFYSSAELDELQNAETAAARGDWAAAAKAYAAITMNPPVPIDAWYHRAIACLKTGDRKAYREICESLLDRVEMNPLHLPPINLVAWICALGPDSVADPRRPVVLADLILKRLPDEPTTRHAYLNTIGGVYLRAGRYEEAVKHLRQGIAATNDGGAKQDWLLLALAYHHLGRPAEARRALASQPADSPLNRRDSIWDSAEIELLEQEVAQALAARPSP
jgi:tetratricopeptide (TPR) repeat protein